MTNLKMGCIAMKTSSLKRFIIVVALFLFSLWISAIWAQTPRILTLEESINIALGQSYEAKRLEQSLINSRMNLKAAEASFKSNGQIIFSSLPLFQEGVRQTPIAGGAFTFDREKFLNLQGEVFVNQPIAATDGVFSLVGSMRRFEQTIRSEIQAGPITTEISTDITDYNPQLRLQFVQPLFTINRRKTGYQKARLNLENTEQQYSRSQLDLIFNVSTNFYNLFRAQRQLEIDQERVRQSENAYRIARLKQQAGLLPEVEALRLEIDLANARNTASNSDATLKDLKDAYKILIGFPITSDIAVVTELDYSPIEVSEQEALAEALKRRTELRSDEIAVELSEISVRETDSQSEIVGELSLRYGIFKVAEEFKDAFQDFDNDRSVRLSLNVPLWDWGKNSAEVQAAEASLNTSRLAKTNRIDEIKREIRKIVRNLQSARQRVEITRRSEELAQKSYRISLLKFESGDLNSQDLALEQNRLTQARLNSLDAMIDYKQSLADLHRKTLWDFEKNQPVEIRIPEGK